MYVIIYQVFNEPWSCHVTHALVPFVILIPLAGISVRVLKTMKNELINKAQKVEGGQDERRVKETIVSPGKTIA